MKPIEFPKDELAHNHAMEWWYWNGHLKDKQGNRYSYMDCLFKANPKKLKILFLRSTPLRTLYFYHSLITDIKRKKSYPQLDYVSSVSKDSFSKPLLFINHTNPIMIRGYFNNVTHETKKGHYFLKTENIELYLYSQKKPLLEGGKGYLRLAGSTFTYYYSLTNLKTKGKIKIRNQWIDVVGKSWMDHQWSNVKRIKDGWTWFSIQLENNIEIVCLEYGQLQKGKQLAGISYPNNKQLYSTNVIFTPLGKRWKSQKTKAKYPLQWRIAIPELKINLVAKALVPRQEILFGNINYWEGPLDITGKIGGRKTSGVGFAELVGYPSEMNNIKIVKNTLSDLMHKGIAQIKGEK